MTAGLACYGIAMYFRDEASVTLHQEPRFIDWEY